MSDTVIKVENLSKSYLLKHQQQESYTNFRDVITNKAKSVFNSSKNNQGTREEFHALNDISFEVNRGDRVGIIGRNGAGKSTLLKILSRIVNPTKGRITIDGRVASLLEVGTGFHPELSGRENIFLNGAILGMSKSEIKNKFDEIVAFSEVEKFLDTPVKRYSSGMYVRLAFAVAAHLEPEILIVDEVLAVGDAEFQKKCIGKMKDVSGEGRTVLFVSHNMAAIQSLCDKAIVLNKGTVGFPLGNVNAAVSEYMHSTKQNAQIEINKRVDRSGEGNIRVTNFEFLDEKNEFTIEPMTGKYVKFSIHYESKNERPLNNITAAISITGDDGVLYSIFGNEFSQGPFYDLVPRGRIDCEVKKLPLVSGKYILNIIINQNGIIQDWIQEAVVFDVSDGDFYGTGRVIPSTHKSVLTDYSWSCK